MEWLKQLTNAIAYIESNLTGNISYDEAAKIACCSTYYFKRMFSYVTGVSPSEYVRRRKMTQAAFDLQNTDSKVLDISYKYGYSSPTAFNRAFQNVHGISPAASRIHGNIINTYPPINFSVTITGGSPMPYLVEQKEVMRIVGIRIQITENIEENQKIIPKFWERSFKENRISEICSLSNSEPKGILGISTYKSPDEMFYYIAVATNKPVPKGMFEYEIPAATWVVFESKGYFKESVQTIFKRFITEWLPFSSYEYAMLPDIEVYPVNDNQLRQGHSEVWIAVKKDKGE